MRSPTPQYRPLPVRFHDPKPNCVIADFVSEDGCRFHDIPYILVTRDGKQEYVHFMTCHEWELIPAIKDIVDGLVEWSTEILKGMDAFQQGIREIKASLERQNQIQK